MCVCEGGCCKTNWDYNLACGSEMLSAFGDIQNGYTIEKIGTSFL